MDIAVDGFLAKASTSTTIGTTALTIKATGQVLNPSGWHHSFAEEYDRASSVTVPGAVVKVDWTNPNVWIYLDTKDEKDGVLHWRCEGESPITLTRQGWTRDSLKQGDQVTIDGYRARNRSNTCKSSAVTLADGKRLFAGSSAEGQR